MMTSFCAAAARRERWTRTARSVFRRTAPTPTNRRPPTTRDLSAPPRRAVSNGPMRTRFELRSTTRRRRRDILRLVAPSDSSVVSVVVTHVGRTRKRTLRLRYAKSTRSQGQECERRYPGLRAGVRWASVPGSGSWGFKNIFKNAEAVGHSAAAADGQTSSDKRTTPAPARLRGFATLDALD
ncbi:hypothetical protein EVAR_25314_1 [Eumeta japonica]|uniref:Uncharacterized protein n=1 Tax=Eumeta variegata TaxID=151549 RepID=A0A4C1VP73_EUMVA|nr:hypothetical protein EVAR_25314_1 [Eumeta japonica]